MKTKIAILVLAISASFNLFSCECGEYELRELDSMSLMTSSAVLLGKVIKKGAIFQIEVIEVFKGEVSGKIIYGTLEYEEGFIESCASFPYYEGMSLFYLDKIEKLGKTYFMLSDCSASRPLNHENDPVSLFTDKSKSELIAETEDWIEYLRERTK